MSDAMSDRAAFIRTICENPHEDFPRLCYADYLDDVGEHERAEFIRGQILNGLESIPAQTAGVSGVRWLWEVWPEDLVGVLSGWSWRCGMIESIEVSCATFMQHARQIFESHPITAVRLVDKRPYYNPDRSEYEWINSWPNDGRGSHFLPPRLYVLVHNYFPTESAAQDALCRACVSFGRSLAGLRPLSD